MKTLIKIFVVYFLFANFVYADSKWTGFFTISQIMTSFGGTDDTYIWLDGDPNDASTNPANCSSSAIRLSVHDRQELNNLLQTYFDSNTPVNVFISSSCQFNSFKAGLRIIVKK